MCDNKFRHTVDPNAESQEVQVPLSVHWVPTQIRISLFDELRVRLETAPRQVNCNFLQVMFTEIQLFILNFLNKGNH
jgi:hypothetical protein